MSFDRTIWQIAAGDGGRDYHDVFLDFGIACVGPGDPGDYFENRAEYDDRNSAAFRASGVPPEVRPPAVRRARPARLGLVREGDLEKERPADTDAVFTRLLTWNDLTECAHHPVADEFASYYGWKRKHSLPLRKRAR